MRPVLVHPAIYHLRRDLAAHEVDAVDQNSFTDGDFFGPARRVAVSPRSDGVLRTT